MKDIKEAIEALKTYDWGSDIETLKPIEEAIIATENDPAGRKEIETKLLDTMNGGISRSALDYVCRRLRVIGTAESVPALAALLPAENTSHIARYALERIPGDGAAGALREAVSKVGDKLKPGMIGSLGTRRDAKSVTLLAKFAGDSDPAIARAAVQSLGLIATPAAAEALGKAAANAPETMVLMVADARLVCAERFLADGHKAEAVALYKELQGKDQPPHVKIAAMKGMMAARTK